MPIAPAIWDINAIWFISISCSISGFAIAIAFMSMPGTPFIGNPPGPIIIPISGAGDPVMLSIRACISSFAYGGCPFLEGPMRSRRLREPPSGFPSLCIARGPVGNRSVRRDLLMWPVGDGERAEAERFWAVGDGLGMA